jgi:hypothetical protein
MPIDPPSDSSEPPKETGPPADRARYSLIARYARKPVVWAAAGLVVIGGTGAILVTQESGGQAQPRPQAALCGLVSCADVRSAVAGARSGPGAGPTPSSPVPSPLATPSATPTPTVPPVASPAPEPVPSALPAPAPAPSNTGPPRPAPHRPRPHGGWPHGWPYGWQPWPGFPGGPHQHWPQWWR